MPSSRSPTCQTKWTWRHLTSIKYFLIHKSTVYLCETNTRISALNLEFLSHTLLGNQNKTQYGVFHWYLDKNSWEITLSMENISLGLSIPQQFCHKSQFLFCFCIDIFNISSANACFNNAIDIEKMKSFDKKKKKKAYQYRKLNFRTSCVIFINWKY